MATAQSDVCGLMLFPVDFRSIIPCCQIASFQNFLRQLSYAHPAPLIGDIGPLKKVLSPK